MTEDNREELQIADYSSKADFSKGEVVRSQVSKCCEIRSKEMKEGYFNYDKMGNKVYIPDTRREFVSAVNALRTLLAPEIERSEPFKKIEKEFIEAHKKVFQRYAIYPHIVMKGQVFEDTSKEKYIPELGERFPVRVTMNRSGNSSLHWIESRPGIFDNNFHSYWAELVRVYDKLFSELSILIDQNNYFKKGVSF